MIFLFFCVTANPKPSIVTRWDTDKSSLCDFSPDGRMSVQENSFYLEQEQVEEGNCGTESHPDQKACKNLDHDLTKTENACGERRSRMKWDQS